MAHEITEHDNMFSVREVPWHGLGTIIDDHPTIEEAIVASGLDWEAEIEKMVVQRIIGNDDAQVTIDIPVQDQFAVVRKDKNIVLGVVGNRYQIYQNAQMWQFIDEFQRQSGIKLETAGSLKMGRTTWVLAKNGSIEAVNGDPIEEYFLFRNSFDGSSPISVLFTNIRVVCNNTLTMALKGARNLFNVRHTASAEDQIKEVQKALGLRIKYQERVQEVVEMLTKKAMSATQTENFLGEVIFPEPKRIVQTVEEGEIVHSLQDAHQRGITVRKNKIDAVLNLVEEGAGADIKGVKGTAWGVYNALTEWADHDKPIRLVKGRDSKEVRFENAFFGTGSQFKADSLNALVEHVA
jgi:phage/plasmid-like protein (TIGR03299 family)